MGTERRGRPRGGRRGAAGLAVAAVLVLAAACSTGAGAPTTTSTVAPVPEAPWCEAWSILASAVDALGAASSPAAVEAAVANVRGALGELESAAAGELGPAVPALRGALAELDAAAGGDPGSGSVPAARERVDAAWGELVAVAGPGCPSVTAGTLAG